MKTKVELITPQIATEILENHNPRNRPVSDMTVQAYASDMKNGRWVVNHQGIAFDINGDLIDGQHRLWAVIFSDKTIETLVTRDLPVDSKLNGVTLATMDTVDRGRIRQNGQQLQLSHGIKNGAAVAAACRGICIMCYPSRGSKRVSMSNTLMVYNAWGTDIDTIIGCVETRKRVSHILAPLSLYHHGEPEKAREFCQQMTTLEGMATPVKTFIKYLETTHGNGATEKSMRILAQCILAFHEGRNLQKVMDISTGQDFLVGMFPSMARKIQEALKPIKAVKLNIKKQTKE